MAETKRYELTPTLVPRPPVALVEGRRQQSQERKSGVESRKNRELGRRWVWFCFCFSLSYFNNILFSTHSKLNQSSPH